MTEEDYFARVQPIVGDGLRDKRVVVMNEIGAETARLLAACRVEHWRLPAGSAALAAELRARYGVADVCCGLDDASVSAADLLIGGGSADDCQRMAKICANQGVAGLALLPSPTGAALVRFNADNAGQEVICDSSHLHRESQRSGRGQFSTPEQVFDYLDLNHHAARIGRSILLGEAQTGDYWQFGDESWPWQIAWGQATSAWGDKSRPYSRTSTPGSGRGHHASCLILGCGSLGSYVARDLAWAGLDKMLLLDYETVDAANPARQFYTRADIGEDKAARLVANIAALGTECVAAGRKFRLEDDETSLMRFQEMVERERPDVVVLTTGTSADYLAARALRRLGVAHIVARCYKRARYFEVVAVDGQRGPCYDCVRGHLYTGPSPSLTPEQLAAYDANVGSGELVGEPATLVESGRAAAVAARLAWQLALPPPQRAGWFAQCMATQATCFLGGNVAEMRPNGWAYGIRRAGQVVVYGVRDILGSVGAEALPCATCGQIYQAGRLV